MKRVEALTGVRALAGLYLLSFHFAQPLFAHAPRCLETLRHSGYIATSFFLMLSGFVLTIAYGKKLDDGRLDGRGFVAARLARLYPVYALALALMLPFALVHRWGVVTGSFGDDSLRYKVATGVASATMTHVLVPRLNGSWNTPGWCVSVEMWFYFAFPFAVVWLLRRRTRALVGVLAGSWGVALALSIAYTVVQPDGFRPDHESSAFWLTLFKFTPYTRWPEFLFGVALGGVWLRRPAEGRGARFATAMLAGGALAIAALLLAGDRIPYTMLHNGTLLPLYALVVWGVMAGRGPLHRALGVRPLTAIGDSSYVLYLVQLPLMQWMVLAARRDYHHIDAPFTIVALAVILATSVAVHFLVETRAQAWLRPRFERLVARVPITLPRRPAPAPAPAPIATAG